MKRLAFVLFLLSLFCGCFAYADGLMPGPGVTFGSTNPTVIFQSDASGDLLFDGTFLKFLAPNGLIFDTTVDAYTDPAAGVYFKVGGVTVLYFNSEAGLYSTKYILSEQGANFNSEKNDLFGDVEISDVSGQIFKSDAGLKAIKIGDGVPEEGCFDVEKPSVFRSNLTLSGADIIESATGTHSVTVGFGEIIIQGGLANGAYNEGMVFDSTTTLNPTIFKVPIPIKELGSQVVVDSFTIQISCDSSTATIAILKISRYDVEYANILDCYSATDATQLINGTKTYEIAAALEDGFQPGQAMWLEFGLATGMATHIEVSGITINYHLE